MLCCWLQQLQEFGGLGSPTHRKRIEIYNLFYSKYFCFYRILRALYIFDSLCFFLLSVKINRIC